MSSNKACGNCKIKYNPTELSGPQQLCKDCRRSLPLATCTYCCIDFYAISSTTTLIKPSCKKCSEHYTKYGDPKACEWCKKNSAFKGTKCFQCKTSEEKYGKPTKCETCQNMAYFDKGLEAKKKVNNKCLCLLCTLKYKKELHRCGKFKRSSAEIVSKGEHRSNKAKKMAKIEEATSSSTTRRGNSIEVGIQNDLCGHSETSSSASPLFSRDEKSGSMEAILLTTQLKEEIASLKRQLDGKDRTIIDKGKQHSELRTEMWELEKKLRKKMLDAGTDNDKKIEDMQGIIRDLKSQNGKLSKLLKQGTRRSTPTLAPASVFEPEATDST